eukprot:1193378-Prorocentrum_minimum.AAC.6
MSSTAVYNSAFLSINEPFRFDQRTVSLLSRRRLSINESISDFVFYLIYVINRFVLISIRSSVRCRSGAEHTALTLSSLWPYCCPSWSRASSISAVFSSVESVAEHTMVVHPIGTSTSAFGGRPSSSVRRAQVSTRAPAAAVRIMPEKTKVENGE